MEATSPGRWVENFPRSFGRGLIEAHSVITVTRCRTTTFPRSFGRGLIEAIHQTTSLLLQAPPFRDLLVAASLKPHVFQHDLPGLQAAFRDLLVAASLKHQDMRRHVFSTKSFRDLLVAASLKLCKTIFLAANAILSAIFWSRPH